MLPNKNSNRNNLIKALTTLSHIGFVIVVCVLIGVISGSFLDGLFSTPPLFLLIFSFIGAAAGFKMIFDIFK